MERATLFKESYQTNEFKIQDLKDLILLAEARGGQSITIQTEFDSELETLKVELSVMSNKENIEGGGSVI